MKIKNQFFAFAISFCFFSLSGYSQGQLTEPHSGGNKKSSLSEMIGLTKITINYDRPGVKGRGGKIWGTSVAHYGLADLGYGSSLASPWRAGANENTTITFSTDVTIEGNNLAEGTYGLFMALGELETTVIFSKNYTSWGSFFYNPAEDALRVVVKNQTLEKSVEWLKYEFTNETENSATIALMWEKRMIPFKVEADVNKIQLASFKNELRTTPGFTIQSYIQAAEYCLRNNVELQQGLIWANEAISGRLIGMKTFQSLYTKAKILKSLNRTAEADSVMNEAIPMGNARELYYYANALLEQKRTKEALDVFKLNYDRFPNTFTTNVGLGMGYSAIGDTKKALRYLNAALSQAPRPENKIKLETMIKNIKNEMLRIDFKLKMPE